MTPFVHGLPINRASSDPIGRERGSLCTQCFSGTLRIQRQRSVYSSHLNETLCTLTTKQSRKVCSAIQQNLQIAVDD